MLGIVRESDLQAHIVRGLFLYLLQFLSAAPADRSPRTSFTEEFEAHRYPHIYDRGVRLRLFETLRRWGERGYVNLDDCVAYGSSSLVAAYICNLRGEREHVQEVVREFYRLSEALSASSNLILVQLLLEEVRAAKTEEGVRRLLVGVAREVLESRRLLEGAGEELEGQDWSSLLVGVEPFFGREARVEVMQLMGFVVQQFSLEQLISHEEHNPMINAICELLHSLHEGAKTLF